VRKELIGELLDKRLTHGGWQGGSDTYMLIHVLGNVGHVKIGVLFVGELLELGVE
jgi:hypothetical protein